MTKLTESIKVSKKLKQYLLDRGTKSDSFEDIIWRLIGMKEIKKEDLKYCRENCRMGLVNVFLENLKRKEQMNK